ncbi:class I SAM-dependent methyltransferase [Rariglobus hedericola]|uniref:Class I SAM-dependent methyltransferase n=2 Tax=Rariglobus hedericola TaxID=2597822 RepID=A0A556QRW1_9BACT|nr:class I SAM-dependent methyltransferase [Rariglobus hedericola]
MATQAVIKAERLGRGMRRATITWTELCVAWTLVNPRTVPMNAEEYANLERIEPTHWYYAGKREMVRRWISRARPPRREDLLLDCGAGTGLFAQEMQGICRVMVLDDHEEALRILKTRFGSEQILSLAGDRVPLPDESLDYVTALDVLEHVPDDAAVVSGFHRLLKKDGIVVITVPASMALWSDWDEALHHYRRYHRAQLRTLFDDSKWEVLQVNYTNIVVYPAVWLVRKWRRRFPLREDRPRSEDRLPPSWLNGMLKRVFVELAMVKIPFPFGVSLVLVARRR